MAKKIIGYIKLQIPAQDAKPSPPVGPALGQRGVNIVGFCKAFNAATQHFEKGVPLPVTVTVYADKSFSFTTKTPPASYFLKQAASIDKGSKLPGRNYVGSVTKDQVMKIAEIKMIDLDVKNVDAAYRTVAGSAASMGIRIEE